MAQAIVGDAAGEKSAPKKCEACGCPAGQCASFGGCDCGADCRCGVGCDCGCDCSGAICRFGFGLTLGETALTLLAPDDLLYAAYPDKDALFAALYEWAVEAAAGVKR